MTIRKVTVAALMILMSSMAFAQDTQAPASAEQMGTPEQRAACRPDVRRLCRHITGENGTQSYLGCLQENRSKLSRACRNVLEGNAQ